MDDDLRNGLWSAVTLNFLNSIRDDYLHSHPPVRDLLGAIWISYFKYPADTLDDWGPKVYPQVREYFFSCKWNEVYDLLEFVAKSYQYVGDPEEELKHAFIEDCNLIMKRELSAYRFVGEEIAQITSEAEIAGIEEALKASAPLNVVHKHLGTALALLSDRKSPDYPNSVKESISSVEVLCKIITGRNSATLVNALDLIEKQGKITIHPALKGAFEKVYGYASSSGGIRHGTIDATEVDFDIAKFMLVACSAFINYLIAKASKAGIMF
jgi:hypothetical protein